MPGPLVATAVVCVNCRGVFHQNISGRPYCIQCLSTYLSTCDRCDVDFMDFAGQENCNSCHEDNDEERCYSCGDHYEADELLWENDRPYCLCCRGGSIERLSNTTFQINKSRRTVGFEIEFCAPRIPAQLRDFGRIKEDGSLSPDRNSHYCKEFASSITAGDRTLQLIDEVCSILHDVKAYTNKTCGLHIHLGMQQSTEEERAFIDAWWCIFEKVFFAIVSPSRRANEFAQDTRSTDSRERYRSLNLTAYEAHGTFEIRLHQGSIDATKIKQWVKILLAFFDIFGKIPPTPIRTNRVRRMDEREMLIYFYKKLQLKLTLRKYVLSRIKEFDKGIGYSYKVIKNLKKKVAA